MNQRGLVMGEDPGLFRTKRGFQLMMHSGGPFIGGHFYSHDGLTWKGYGQRGYNGTVEMQGGGTRQVCQRQRPQVVMGGPDGLTPIALANGAQPPPGGPGTACPDPWTFAEPTMTLVLPLVQPE